MKTAMLNLANPRYEHKGFLDWAEVGARNYSLIPSAAKPGPYAIQILGRPYVLPQQDRRYSVQH